MTYKNWPLFDLRVASPGLTLGVSRALGYRPGGESLHARGDRADVMKHMRLVRADWLASGTGDHIQISGFEPCRPLFGLAGGQEAGCPARN
jgi:hypothetical protein